MKKSWKIGTLALSGFLFYSVSFGQLGNLDNSGGGRQGGGRSEQSGRNSGRGQSENRSSRNENRPNRAENRQSREQNRGNSNQSGRNSSGPSRGSQSGGSSSGSSSRQDRPSLQNLERIRREGPTRENLQQGPIGRRILENVDRRERERNSGNSNNSRNSGSSGDSRNPSSGRPTVRPVDPRSGVETPRAGSGIRVEDSRPSSGRRPTQTPSSGSRPGGITIEDSRNSRNQNRNESNRSQRPGTTATPSAANPAEPRTRDRGQEAVRRPSDSPNRAGQNQDNENRDNNRNNRDRNNRDNQNNQNRNTPDRGASPVATPTSGLGEVIGTTRQERREENRNDRQERRQSNEEARREARAIKLDQRRGTPVEAGGRPAAPGVPNANQGLGGVNRREDRRLSEGGRRSQQQAEKAVSQLGNLFEKNDRNFNRRNLSRAERSVLIGANAAPRGRDDLRGLRNYISSDNRRYNNYIDHIRHKNVHNRHRNTYINIFVNNVYNDFRNNIIPAPYRPWGGYGRIHQPIMYPVGGYNNYLLPPPAPIGSGPLSMSLSWNYWDGRAYYDHGYARGLFGSIGHRPHNGYDGIVVQGRYWSYGWGWIDGCIDYGDRRIWVPGFWAPYTVEECGTVPVWIPPVYEDVWTGCCWERIQVDGGYFADPVVDCRMVTRYTWVPGHYQYYY